MGKAPFVSLKANRREILRFMGEMRHEFNALPSQMRTAEVMALNESVGVMRQAGLDLAGQEYALKSLSSRFKSTVTMVRASKSRPYIIFRANGRESISLGDFRTGFGKRKGASVQVLLEGQKKPLIKEEDGKVYKGFRIKGRNSGKVLIATRTPEVGPDGREKIKVLYGPGLVPFFRKPRNRVLIANAAMSRFQKRFRHNIAHLTDKLSKRLKG